VADPAERSAAAYLVRNPLSLKKLVYLDGQQAVLYRSRMNPSLGRNFEAMDSLEWLARVSDQRMSILAFVSDQHSISRILEHLGLRSSTCAAPRPIETIDVIPRLKRFSRSLSDEDLGAIEAELQVRPA
jgi:hypothetical protein